MITYRIKAEWHIQKEIGLYRAFGICLYRHRQLLLHIPDVFCRKQQALRFAAVCNREQPALVHVLDVIEDFI